MASRGQSTELGSDKVLALVLDEVYKDGEVSAEERVLIDQVRAAFALPPELCSKLEARARQRFREGKLGSKRALSKLRVHEKCLALVLADGEVTPEERQIVDCLGNLLGISKEDHARCVARAKAGLKARNTAAPTVSVAAEAASEPALAPPVEAPSPAAPATSPAELRARIDESMDLSTKAASGGVEPQVLERTMVLASWASQAMQGDSEELLAGFKVAVNIAPILVLSRQLERVEQLLASGLARGSEIDELEIRFEAALMSCFAASTRYSAPPWPYEIAGMAFRLAPWASASAELVRVAASIARCAARSNGSALDMLREMPADIPEALEAVRAGAYADRVVSSLASQRGVDAWQALEELRKLHQSRRLATIGSVLAEAAGNWLHGAGVDESVPQARFISVVKLLTSLAEEAPSESCRSRALAAASEAILDRLQSKRDEAGVREHVERLKNLASRSSGDEELAFDLARGVSRAAVARVHLLKPADGLAGLAAGVGKLFGKADPELTSLRETLENLTRQHPSSKALASARSRFKRVTGMPVQAPAGATPEPASLHPHVLALQTAFQRIQRSPRDQSAEKAYFEALLSGFPARIRSEGPSVFEKDELYFLDVVDEVERQLLEDRAEFWRYQTTKLEILMRGLAEDATPRVARKAQALCARYRWM